MTDTVRLVVTGVVAVFFLRMGLYGLVMPAALIRPFGIALPDSTARAERCQFIILFPHIDRRSIHPNPN